MWVDGSRVSGLSGAGAVPGWAWMPRPSQLCFAAVAELGSYSKRLALTKDSELRQLMPRIELSRGKE